MHGDIQVARRGAPQPGLALAGQPDALAVLDARRDPHVDGAGPGGDTGAPAFVAGMLDDRAAATTVGARFGEPERALVAVDHPGAVTGRADLRAGAGARPAAVAVGARRRAGEPQRHGDTLGRLEEVEVGFGLEVLAAARPTGARLRAPSEQPAEQVADVGPAVLTGLAEQVVEVEPAAAVVVDGVVAAPAAAVEAAAETTAAGEQPPGLVVLLALGRVGQHIAGLADLLVALIGDLVVGVAVGVVLGEQLAGDPLDLVLAGVRGDAEHLVEVLLDPFSLNHAASPPHHCRGYESDSAFCEPDCSPLAGVSDSADTSSTASTTPTRACRSTWSPSL